MDHIAKWMFKSAKQLRRSYGCLYLPLYSHRTCNSGYHTSPSSCSMKVFDRHSKLLQRERAAQNKTDIYDYLMDEVGVRLSDRLLDIKREFSVGLDLGCGRGYVSKNIDDSLLSHLHMTDYSPSMLEACCPPKGIRFTKTVADEEETLPFKTDSMDIVLSNLNLHWVNNLPGCLKEVYRVLKKDGVFLASVFGGNTLYELRSSFVLAELEREGGFASHISPFTEINDVGGLLHDSGFTMLTIDTDELTIGYPSLFELMWDLKGMGENNAAITRKPHLHRDTMVAAAAVYQEMYGNEKGIPATFQIIYMIGWKPDPSQAVSQARRGSGEISLKDLHRLQELVNEKGMEGRVKFINELQENKDEYDK